VRQSRAFWMNSVLLLDPEHAVVVDPGVLPSELEDLVRASRVAEPEGVTLVFTHAHWDHVLGRPWWPAATTFAHDRFAAEVRRDAAKIARKASELAAEHGERWATPFAAFTPDRAASGLHFTKIGAWRVVARDAFSATPRASSACICRTSFVDRGRHALDIEIPILDGPCATYIATLEGLETLARHGAIETVIPGHGAIAHGRDAVLARFATDLVYLRALEHAAREAVAAGGGVEQLRDRLSGMDYTGRRSSVYSTDSFHEANLGFAVQGVTANA
jgi:glyoxylase-like metal-dependent hydrolase (beta-lactamase superfamily II)